MLLSLFILGCNNNKPAEKAEKVETDPVTVQINSCDIIKLVLTITKHMQLGGIMLKTKNTQSQ